MSKKVAIEAYRECAKYAASQAHWNDEWMFNKMARDLEESKSKRKKKKKTKKPKKLTVKQTKELDALVSILKEDDRLQKANKKK